MPTNADGVRKRHAETPAARIATSSLPRLRPMIAIIEPASTTNGSVCSISIGVFSNVSRSASQWRRVGARADGAHLLDEIDQQNGSEHADQGDSDADDHAAMT